MTEDTASGGEAAPSPPVPSPEAAGRSRRPQLLVSPRRGDPRAVALFLPGGPEEGTDPPSRRRPAFIRMHALAADLRRATWRQGLAVGTLRYRVAGWNGAAEDPVVDARWALTELGRRFGPAPVALIGVSMGGRVALKVADHPNVVGVLALAPWLPPDEPVADLAGTRVLIEHGDADTATDPVASRDWAQRATDRGHDVRYVSIPGAGHGFLAPISAGRRIVLDGVRDVLGDRLG